MNPTKLTIVRCGADQKVREPTRTVVARVTANQPVPTKITILEGNDRTECDLAILWRAWRQASRDARHRFLTDVG